MASTRAAERALDSPFARAEVAALTASEERVKAAEAIFASARERIALAALGEADEEEEEDWARVKGIRRRVKERGRAEGCMVPF